jgi:hypothetical protein
MKNRYKQIKTDMFKLLETFREEFFKSIDNIKERPYYMILPIAIDFLHVIVFAGVVSYLQARAEIVIDSLRVLQQEAVKYVGEVMTEENLVVMAKQSEEMFQSQDLLLRLGVWLLFSASMMWILFQGHSWRAAAKITSKKVINYWRYMARFMTLSLVWLIVINGVIVWFMNRLFQAQFTIHRMQDTQSLIVSSIIWGVTLYFLFISYALINKYDMSKIFQKTFKVGYKHFLTIIPLYLLLVGGFFLIDLILKLFYLVNSTVMFVVAMMILFPYLVWAKIYITRIITDKC